MKKNIALFLSIIVLILAICLFRVNLKNEHLDLSGNIISSGIYRYDLQTHNSNVNGLFQQDDEIYYLLMNENEETNVFNYELKKINIKTNEIILISKIDDTQSYCTLEDHRIYCQTDNLFEVYDLKFNKIFSNQDETKLGIDYAPYKDIYLKIEDKNIYLLRSSKEHYRTISFDQTLLYETYYKTKDNTYLLYFDELGNYYLYDVNLNQLENINKSSYFKVEQGLIFYDDKEFIIKDLEENKEVIIENKLEENYYYSGTVNDSHTTLYLYDIIENNLLIENMEEDTLQIIDTTLLSENNPISKIINQNNYLYIYILQDTNNFYVIDLNQLEEEKIKLKDYTNELLHNINTKIDDIANNYHVNIKIKDNAIINFPDFYAQTLTNNEIILESLNKINEILEKYDVTFFDTFYENNNKGLNLYLVGELTPSDYETQVSNPAAYSLTYNNEYMIVIDLNQPNIEELLCHELLHNLEFNLQNKGLNPFPNWNSYNPPNFSYNDSYTSSNYFNYTLTEANKEDVYFIDEYSHTYASEDRSRIFEKICACNDTSVINDYPNLYQKGLYLKEEITKYYPSLINTNLFASLNEE